MSADVLDDLLRLGSALDDMHRPITGEQVQRNTGRHLGAAHLVAVPLDRDTEVSMAAEPRRPRLSWLAVAATIVVVCGLAPLVWWRSSPTTSHGTTPRPAASTPPQIGSEAPDATMALLDAGDVTLSQLRGLWLVLQFTNGSCGPCRDTQQALADLDSRIIAGRSDIRVITIGVDTDETAVRALLDEHGTTGLATVDDGTLAATFGVQRLPETWIVDPSGAIAFHAVGPQDADDLYEALSDLVSFKPAVTPSSVPTGSASVVVDRTDAITLAGDPGTVPTVPPGGPYTTFDLSHLPDDWTVEVSRGGHPITDPDPAGYRWSALLTNADGRRVHLMTRFGPNPFTDTTGTQQVVDGRLVTLRDGALLWHEPNNVLVVIEQPGASRDELLDLRQRLPLTSTDRLSAPTRTAVSDQPRGVAMLSGTISGTPWTLYSEPSAFTWLGVDVDPFDVRSAGGGSASPNERKPDDAVWDLNALGLGPEGVLMWGIAPAGIDRIEVDTEAGTTAVPVSHDRDGFTLFAVPDPAAMLVLEFRFLQADGTVVHTAFPPRFPMLAIDGYGAAPLPFGIPAGQQLATTTTG